MCLILSELKKKVANRDIICHKVLMKDEEGKYISPIAQVDYTDAVNERGIMKANDGNPEKIDIGIYCIDNGFIHTFSTFEEASTYAEGCCGQRKNKIGVYELCIFKCAIPKGVEYYDNVRSNNHGNYCSREIKVLEDVTEAYFNPKLNEIDK